MKAGVLIIISAPSGAGKTSLVKALLSDSTFKELLQCVVTYTTRSPRSGDVHGKDYYFVAESVFLSLIDQGFFIEWSTAYGNYYGTPRSVLDEVAQGLSRIVILDRAGAKKVAEAYSKALLLWITPPSLEALRVRLLARATESEDQIERRLLLAQEEMEAEKRAPFYTHYMVNDVFEHSLDFLKKIVIFALN